MVLNCFIPFINVFSLPTEKWAKKKLKHLKSHLLYSQTRKAKYGSTPFKLNDASNIYLKK